jgi:putative glutamine amidotransferase
MTKFNKKVIGIPGWRSYDGDSFGAGTNHLDFISTFGNPRIIMPWEGKVKVDLLYLPGGLDLAPTTYGAVPRFKTTNHDVFKEFFYRERLSKYINNTPIFGVCLGMQMLSVYFGSKLTQNLIFHEQSDARWQTAHSVTVINPQHQDNGEEEEQEFEVNSHHHQCVLKSQLSEELTPLCKADADGEPFIDADDYIVEAFRHNTLPIVGVQWHPEELYDDFSLDMIPTLTA